MLRTRPRRSAIPIDTAYQSTIQAAFARWAAVSGLTFTQVADAQSVQVRMGFGSFNVAAELGETDYRFSRGVLAGDTLVRLLDPATSATSVAATLTLDGQGNYVFSRYGVTL